MVRRKRPVSRRAAVRDGFDNFALKLGLGQDNQLAKGGYVNNGYQTRDQAGLEDMYRSSWVVDRMVNVVAEDMIRGGFDVQGDFPDGRPDELMRELRRTGVPGRLSDAIKWSRLYGGALAVILIEGDDLAEPLIPERVDRGSFRGLYVLDRWQVTPSQERIAELGPMLGYPAFYRINTPEYQVAGDCIHHSRAIRFVGVELSYQQRQNEEWWGGSVVDRAYDRILALDSATQGAANLLYKSFLRIIGVDRLREVLAMGGKAETALVKMFDLIRQFQSNEGITLLDKNDTFTTAGYSFAGLYDAIQAFAEQIAGATGIPLVRLLGQSPKGFSTGESDLRTYYDTIATLQDDDLRPAYELICAVLSYSLWGESLPDDFALDFRSLYQPSDLERSQIATADAQAVAALASGGLLTPAQALRELRDAGRVTGRFASLTDDDIQAAESARDAPAMPPEYRGAAPDPAGGHNAPQPPLIMGGEG